MIHPVTRFDYQMGMVVARRSRFLEELSSGDYEIWDVDSSAMLADGPDDDRREEKPLSGEYDHGLDGDTVIEI